MSIGIYGIFRKTDDKCMYIGQSKNCESRIKKHLNQKTNTLSLFNIDEYYGYVVEEHFFNNNEFRLNREAFWINVLNPEINKMRNRTHCKETIEQNRKSQIERFKDPLEHIKTSLTTSIGLYEYYENTPDAIDKRKMSLNKPDVKKKMRDAKIGNQNAKGHHPSDESNEQNRIKHTGSNNAQYGKHWYTNGVDSFPYFPGEEPEGWYLGRTSRTK